MQIGDPFTGKKLIESSLELVERGLVESLQDCGAAGLASSLAEMARDGAGVDVDLDRVPLREDEMEAWEIMVSESQERMVACVADRLEQVEAICEKWELAHAVIGEVTDTGELRCFHDGELVGAIPAGLLTDECPRYESRGDRERQRRCGLPIRTRRAGAGSTSDTTSSSARGPCAGRGLTRRCCGWTGTAASRSRSTGRRSASEIPSEPAPWPCSTRRATSPAPAASRSASRTA